MDGSHRFVTLEGIDGAGKSTLTALLRDALDPRGADAYFTREETRTPMGEAVRRSIEDKAHPLATCYLFLADRAEHLRELVPLLAEGRLVVSDRYHDSTRAYQAVTLGEYFQTVEAFEAWLKLHTDPWLVHPARTYLLDLDAETAGRRLDAGRSATTQYEKVAFLEAVRQQYLRIAKEEPARVVVLDARKKPEELVTEILADLEASGVLPGA